MVGWSHLDDILEQELMRPTAGTFDSSFDGLSRFVTSPRRHGKSQVHEIVEDMQRQLGVMRSDPASPTASPQHTTPLVERTINRAARRRLEAINRKRK